MSCDKRWKGMFMESNKPESTGDQRSVRRILIVPPNLSIIANSLALVSSSLPAFPYV